MNGTAARLGGGFLALAAIWIGVYWFWEPSRSAEVTFADAPTVEADPTPEPITPVEVLGGDPEPEPGPATANAAPPPPEPETAPPGASSEEAAGVIPPEFREYSVRDGDSFSTISRRFFGSTRHAGAIAAANPFVSPTNLRKGQKLRVPIDPENVQGLPLPGSDPSPAAPEMVEYSVVAGDTLSELSQRFYGTLRYAEVIFNANRDTMQRMDDLQIGDVLRIPSRESVLGDDDR